MSHPAFLRNLNISTIARNMTAEQQKRRENELHRAQQQLGPRAGRNA